MIDCHTLPSGDVVRWDNPDHLVFDIDSAVYLGLDIYKLGYKTSVSEDIMGCIESTMKAWYDVGIIMKGLLAKDGNS